MEPQKPFPGTNLSPDEKIKPETGTRIGKEIFSTYQTFYSKRRQNIVENRAYANNNQDPDQYKSLIDPSFNAGVNKNKLYSNQNSLVNISWRVWSPAKKFVNAVVGLFIDSRHGLQYTSIDKGSKSEKERKKNELLAGIYGKQFMQAVAEIMGGDVMPSGEEAVLTSSEDVDLYMETTYKQIKEIGMEMLVDHVLQKNDYFETIEPRVLHDLIENNKMFTRVNFSANKSINIRYADIVNYIGTESDHPTNKYSDYDAEIEYFTISELRDQMCDAPKKEIEELLFNAAKLASGKYGNPTANISFRYDGVVTEYPWNDYRIQGLVFAWNTIDSEYIRYKKKGEKAYVDRRKSLPEKPEADYTRSEWGTIYEGIYIPVLNKTVAWKRQENMVRPLNDNGSSSDIVKRFIFVEPNKRNGTSSSLVDDMKSCLNEIQVSILKIRQLIAESGPPGLAVDWDALSEVMIAEGQSADPKDLIEVMRLKGVLFYAGRDESGQRLNLPIQEIKSDFAVSMGSHLNYISAQINMIREATGVNEAVDGTVNNSKALVGIQRMKAISAHRLLRELFNAYSQMYFKRLGETLRDMIQTQIKYGWREKEYRDVIGDACYEVLKLDNNQPFPLFGCHVVSVPTEDELNQIHGQLEIGLKAGTLTPADTINVMSIGNTKKILATLQYRERKRIEQKQKEMQMATEFEQKKIQAASEARVQAEAAIAKARSDAKIAEIQAEYDAKLRVEQEKVVQMGANKIREIHATANRDDEQIVLQAAVGGGGKSGPRPTPGVVPTPPAKSSIDTETKP
jgi:hypothetical protein